MGKTCIQHIIKLLNVTEHIAQHACVFLPSVSLVCTFSLTISRTALKANRGQLTTQRAITLEGTRQIHTGLRSFTFVLNIQPAAGNFTMHKCLSVY